MTITYSLLSSQVPLPLAPPLNLSVGNGSSGPFATGMTQGVSQLLNMLVAKVQIVTQVGGGGTGIINGLNLSTTSRLNLEASAGTAYAGDVVSVPNGITTLLPDNSATVFIWLTSTGAIAWNQDHTLVPGGGLVYLGCATTATGVITAIDYSGRVSIIDGQRWRQTNDAIAPVDVLPTSVRVFTQTQFGVYFWNGTTHAPMHDASHQLLVPTRALSLQADITLQSNDANRQWLIANGAIRKVVLPSSSALDPGHHFEIINAGDKTNATQNYNLNVQDSLGNNIVTIQPGQIATIDPLPGANGTGIVWPSSVVASSAF